MECGLSVLCRTVPDNRKRKSPDFSGLSGWYRTVSDYQMVEVLFELDMQPAVMTKLSSIKSSRKPPKRPPKVKARANCCRQTRISRYAGFSLFSASLLESISCSILSLCKFIREDGNWKERGFVTQMYARFSVMADQPCSDKDSGYSLSLFWNRRPCGW